MSVAHNLLYVMLFGQAAQGKSSVTVFEIVSVFDIKTVIFTAFILFSGPSNTFILLP